MYISPNHPDRERLLNPTAAPVDSGRRLATFPRGQGSELRVTADEFNGRPFVRLQVWEAGRGRMWPVKGRMATVRMGDLAGLIEALVDLEREEAPKPAAVPATTRGGRGPAPATAATMGPRSGGRMPPPDAGFDEVGV